MLHKNTEVQIHTGYVSLPRMIESKKQEERVKFLFCI